VRRRFVQASMGEVRNNAVKNPKIPLEDPLPKLEEIFEDLAKNPLDHLKQFAKSDYGFRGMSAATIRIIRW
jgi:hypothetical protein